MAFSHLHSSSSITPLGSTGGGYFGILTYHCHNYYTLRNPLSRGGCGLNAFNHILKFQVRDFFPYPALVPLVQYQVSGGTAHKLIKISHSSCTLLHGGSLASHCSQYIGRCSLPVCHCKRSHQGCFNRPSAKGSVISACNPLAARRCALCRQEFYSSLSDCGRGNLNIYNKGPPAMLERMGRLGSLRGCTKQCHFCPKLADFWLFYLGLDWLGILLVFTIKVFQPFWKHIIMMLQIILLSQVNALFLFASCFY